MDEATKKVSDIFDSYHRFDDGFLLSFEYYYERHKPLAVKMVFYARNHMLEGNVWRKVRVVVNDVHELCAKVKGRTCHAICLGVKLLNFEGLWCIDIDGNYSMGEDPSSLDEVRQYGDCYVIGGVLEAEELID